MGRRLTIAAISAIGLMVALSPPTLATESALTQQPQPACTTFTHRYLLSAGSAITVNVGFVDTSFAICRGRDGFITRADVRQSSGETGPGTLAGFVIEPSLAVVSEQTGTTAKARYEGRLRICIAQRTSICSESHEYQINADFSPVGPTLQDRAAPTWSHAEEAPGGVHYQEDV